MPFEIIQFGLILSGALVLMSAIGIWLRI